MPERARRSTAISQSPGDAFTRRTVTATLMAIAALTFAFSFGNIWTLGLRLGVQPWLAPLIGPAVDLSVVGLLVGIRYCTLKGASPTRLRPARALLVFSGLATLALNIAEPVLAREYGRACFDAVGPLLLIGWSEVGPSLLREIHGLRANVARRSDSETASRSQTHRSAKSRPRLDGGSDSVLLERAREADVLHRVAHGRPISSDTLRRELAVSTSRARQLAAHLRKEQQLPEVQSDSKPEPVAVKT